MPAHFTPATFAFLTELAANNNREWFRANKSRYDEDPDAWLRASGDKRFGASFELSGDSLIRAPKGFRIDHPLIKDLRRKDFIGVAHLSESAVLSPDFLTRFAGLCGDATPFQRWLCGAIGVPF